MKKNRKTCVVSAGRWMSYAAAGAVTALAASEAEAFSLHYSGPLTTTVKAGSGSVAPNTQYFMPALQGGTGVFGEIGNGNVHGAGNKAKAYFNAFAESCTFTYFQHWKVAGQKVGPGNFYGSKLPYGLKIATQHLVLPHTSTSLLGGFKLASSNAGGNFKWGGATGTTGYLAFTFTIGATTEYGWVEMKNFTGSPKNGIELLGYAYSNDPNFRTGELPEPATLGLLAMGAAGVLAFRGRRKRAVNANR